MYAGLEEAIQDWLDKIFLNRGWSVLDFLELLLSISHYACAPTPKAINNYLCDT